MDGGWIAAGVGFLAGALVLGLITSLVMLIDIRLELHQTRRSSRGGQRSAGLSWESSKRSRVREDGDELDPLPGDP